MPIQKECKIVEAVGLNQYAVSITLEAGEIAATAQVGQFVHIKCGEGLLLRRPISICDYQEGLLRIVFEVRGEGTEWLAQRGVGDMLDVMGPLGHGFDVCGRKLLLVGGGIGVPPMLACAKKAEGEVTAVLGFRSAERAMLVQEFDEECAKVYVASDDGTIGEHGLVDAVVLRLTEKENNFTDILACGPRQMLKAVAGVAAELGIACQVSMEERMGCGVGACLVCACKTADGHYKHACKDGPVFRAEEVDWNE